MVPGCELNADGRHGLRPRRVPLPCVVSVFLTLSILGLSAGCLSPGGSGDASIDRAGSAGEPTNYLDRMMRTYSDLRSGRFVIIADFEQPHQMELVGLVNGSGRARFAYDVSAGRKETGPTALQFTAGDADDSLVFSNAAAKSWSLKRDWRSYDLLMLSIHAPQPDLMVDVTIQVGGEQGYDSVQSTVALDRGWNLARLDLADVADHVPLGDVREIRLSVKGAPREAVTLTIDDMVLASNSQVLMGEPGGAPSSLYVIRKGRRWHVGSTGRYELAFAHGQIVGWFNLAEDPYCRRNLVKGTTLSPMPIVLEGDTAQPDVWASGALRVHPRILEMSPVRVVLETEWLHLQDAGADVEDQPFQRWRYTMYPTGQVYVTVSCSTRADGWEAERMGLTFGLAAAAEDGVQTETRTDLADPPTYAVAVSEEANYGLFFTLDGPARYTRTLNRRDDGTREILFAVSKDESAPDIASWSGMLAVSPLDARSWFEPRVLGRSFAQPPSLEILAGEASPRGESYGVSVEGFDRVSGSYRLLPENDTCRFVVHGESQPLAAPVFVIEGIAPGDAWVYVDHRLQQQVAKDRDGNLIFQLPGLVATPTLVEVMRKPVGRAE